MNARRPGCWIIVLIAAALAAGCDSLITGTKTESIALQAQADGSFAPVKITLAPEMSPVALNLRAENQIRPDEFGKWNRYRATLSRDGSVRATQAFDVNYLGSRDGQPDAPYQLLTMMTFVVPEAGDYELAITPAKPIEVTLQNVRLELRRNVELVTPK